MLHQEVRIGNVLMPFWDETEIEARRLEKKDALRKLALHVLRILSSKRKDTMHDGDPTSGNNTGNKGQLGRVISVSSGLETHMRNTRRSKEIFVIIVHEMPDYGTSDVLKGSKMLFDRIVFAPPSFDKAVASTEEFEKKEQLNPGYT